MESKRQSRVEERHDDIMREYDIVIKELGNIAPYVSRSYIYGQVADRLHYSSDHVNTVIKRRLRKRRSYK